MPAASGDEVSSMQNKYTLHQESGGMNCSLLQLHDGVHEIEVAQVLHGWLWNVNMYEAQTHPYIKHNL